MADTDAEVPQVGAEEPAPAARCVRRGRLRRAAQVCVRCMAWLLLDRSHRPARTAQSDLSWFCGVVSVL